MKRRWFRGGTRPPVWLIVLALGATACPVLAAGLYPGVMCRGIESGQYDDVYYYRGRAENDTALSVGVYCSVYREDIDDDPAGWIYLLDQNPYSNLTCTLRCRSSSSGSQSYSSTLYSSGASATPVQYQFSNPPSCGTDWSLYIWCNIPEKYGSARSGVVSYYVWD